jgi:hypothetical protein
MNHIPMCWVLKAKRLLSTNDGETKMTSATSPGQGARAALFILGG